jgi:undecaprenyl-diphosphatase
MDAWLQAVFLGVIQGLTEFLPVSSSGHLVLAQAWLGEAFVFADQAVMFDLVLHIGTLLPVIYFYRRDLRAVFGAYSPEHWRHIRPDPVAWLKSDPNRWLGFLVCVATVPTGIIGLSFKDTFEGLFLNVPAVCISLGITGVLLMATRIFEKPGSDRDLSVPLALLIGAVQGIAVTPGISRSGSTIAVALLIGVSRVHAARFSFLMSLPAILGAVVLKSREGLVGAADHWAMLVVGFLVSAMVGYLALRTLVLLVRHGNFYRFAYYVWPLALTGYVLLG